MQEGLAQGCQRMAHRGDLASAGHSLLLLHCFCPAPSLASWFLVQEPSPPSMAREGKRTTSCECHSNRTLFEIRAEQIIHVVEVTLAIATTPKLDCGFPLLAFIVCLRRLCLQWHFLVIFAWIECPQHCPTISKYVCNFWKACKSKWMHTIYREYTLSTYSILPCF